MKAAMIVVVGVVLVGGAVTYMLTRTSPTEGEPSTDSNGTVENSNTDDTTVDFRGETSDRADPVSDDALERLRAEVEGAETLEYRSDADRLADAWAWVREHRDADSPYNELEATMLALMDVVIDGESKSAEWLLNTSEIELEMILAIDADGDGQVTDEEVDQFAASGILNFNPMQHPYLRERLDRDGDGEVTPQELERVATAWQTGVMAGAIERATIDRFDTNMDGFLSDDERTAGERLVQDQALLVMSGMIGMDETLTEVTEAQVAEARAKIVEQYGEDWLNGMEAQRETMTSQMVALPLQMMMRLDDTEAPAMNEMLQDMPQPPDAAEFMSEDGTMSEESQAVYMDAMALYQEEVQTWGARMAANRTRQQFEHATSLHDLDADGLLSSAEWETRTSELFDARDERLFLGHYDLDGSGRVDPVELETYLEWYHAESLRADVNFDGRVDQRDVQAMVEGYEAQGG